MTHFHEPLDARITHLMDPKEKVRYFNYFKEHSIIENQKVVRTSWNPRIIPNDYHGLIVEACKAIMQVVLGASTMTPEKIRETIVPSSLNNYLIETLGVLDYRRDSLFGGGRIDMAISGPMVKSNPPKLIELNLMGYCAMGANYHACNALQEINPELRDGFSVSNALHESIRNVAKAGTSAIMVMSDWNEAYCDPILLTQWEDKPLDLSVIDRKFFAENFSIKNNKAYLRWGSAIKSIDAVYFRDMDRPEVLQEHESTLKALLKSEVTMYDNYTTMMFENKAWLPNLRGGPLVEAYANDHIDLLKAIVPRSLPGDAYHDITPEQWVLKEVDTHGGKAVYVKDAMIPLLPRVKKNPQQYSFHECIVFTTRDVQCEGEESGRGYLDLTVFVAYTYDAKTNV